MEYNIVTSYLILPQVEVSIESHVLLANDNPLNENDQIADFLSISFPL